MRPGIYIHIPFCRSRCSYCDFATDIYRDQEAVERYVGALCTEISNFGSHISDEPSDTIYFGGGTPSLLTAPQLERILKALSERFSFTDDPEFTLEMNPGTVSAEKLRDYRSLGVNRASFGVQTFDERALRLLARAHDADDARRTYELLRGAGFDNVSFDLIAGLPGQTLVAWDDNLSQALALDPEHLSLYLLEIHEGTPLAEQLRTGRRPLPDEDLAGEMYELMAERVTAAGFEHYEISNFARGGRQSRHNNKYWLLEPVYGFGVSAHSYDGRNRRWSNERDTDSYVGMIESAGRAVSETEILDERRLAGEMVFLNLRLSRGLDTREYLARFGRELSAEYERELRELEREGLIETADGVIRLTRRGRLFSNEVFAVFV